MQGYIIHINPSRDEDLIVTLLTQKHIITSYRFYGARHANIHLGYKIDAELIHTMKANIPQLRNVLHLGYRWNSKRDRMFFWQNFLTLLHKHLRGIEEIESFYFFLLDEMANKLDMQNPKRLALESYVKILRHEGRLHEENICFLCEKQIYDDFTLARGFLPAHAQCISTHPLNLLHVKNFLHTASTLLLNDEEVDELWKVLQEGL